MLLHRTPENDCAHRAQKTALNHKPAVVGIKVRLGNEIQGADDIEYLKRGIQAAEVAGIPVYAHVDGTSSPLEALLPLFRKGDVYAHYLNGHPNGILDVNGKILPVVLEARSRGVLFDAAEGGAHLNFTVAQKCMEQNFLPDQLSTDLSLSTAPTHDLPILVSKFLALGVDIDKAIQMVTLNPGRNFNFGQTLGTLQVGSAADISIFELQTGSFEFTDGYKQKRPGTQRLVNTAVVRHGQLLVNRA